MAGVLMLSGCATKGFVSGELEALRTEMQAKDTELAASLDEVRNSASEALARAELAAGASGEARELALGRMGYQIADTYAVAFGFNSAELTPESREILAEVEARVRNHPEYLIDIYGHTDASGSASYNLMLGQKRAEAVMRHLVADTPADLHRYAAVSFGEESAGTDAAGSRRVDVNLILRVAPTELDAITENR
ncbi:MAG: OmpA family protein [Candidatus Eisenbacteria bacterium]|uniref:OmpA family protein n=1 Tax=Eiseniibacteriota bacterium TaxID=2212470 RepID=A0A956RPI2_UNCEI|nr:OmpA family protein [Candidatus Eisenbacteria bacterium]